MLNEPLLTADDEVELARTIEAGLMASAVLAGQPCSLEVRRDELEALAEAGRRARERFLRANLRLVAQVALRAARRSDLPPGELFQEGALSLVEAVDRFDHRQGVRFATYALPWIRSYVHRLVDQRCGGVQLGRSAAERRMRLRAAYRELFHRFGTDPTAEDLADELGWSVTAVCELLRHEHTSGIEDGQGNVIQLEDVRAQRAFDQVLERATPMPPWLGRLSELEQAVIRQRFGFDQQPTTQRQTAARLGITIGRVRLIEQRVLERLRAAGPGVLTAA